MDDTQPEQAEKYYTIQVKGTAYRFAPIDAKAFETLVMVNNMSASPMKAVKALTQALAKSAGPDQWDEITDRLLAGELEARDVTVTLLEKILKRQAKDDAAKANGAQ